jgi:hypothetical protein
VLRLRLLGRKRLRSYASLLDTRIKACGVPCLYVSLDSPWLLTGAVRGDTTVTTISKETFYIQTLSAPGLSRGAVVATGMGEIVGFVGGDLDAEEEGAEKRLLLM